MPNEDCDKPVIQTTGVYLLAAYGITWAVLIPMIKGGLDEAWLGMGTAGPALAAMIQSRRGSGNGSWFNLRRLVLFAGLCIVCWLVLCCRFQWNGASSFALHLKAWLLVPSAVPAWIVSGTLSRDAGVRELMRRLTHSPNWWTVLPLLCWIVLLLAPAGLAHVMHLQLTKPEFRGGTQFVIAQGIAFFAYNVFFAGVQEEPGWRGFLLDRLQVRFSPLVAALMVWLPWSLWHAPLDWYRPVRFSLVNWVLIRVIMAIPINILLAWFYNRSGRSIQSTAMFHAGTNTFPFVLPYYAPAFALVFLWAGYAVVNGRMWRRLDPEKPREPTAEQPAFETSQGAR